MSTTDRVSPTTRWAVPGVAALAGAAYLVAGLVGDDVAFGVAGLLLMLGAGGAFLLAARWSETAAGLRDRTDERINEIDRSASLTAGMVVLLAALLMFVVEIAQGEDGSPYYQLGALGGVSYVVSLTWLRYRR
jgi:peptidoglycan/LPS O-acetylase OafA/YrhL